MAMRGIGLAALLLVFHVPAHAQELAKAIFLEPEGKIDARGAEVAEKMPIFRRVADPSKYAGWLKNEAAQRALRLYRAAYEIVHPGGTAPDYYVALVPGGNHAAVGFRLRTGESIEEHPTQPYILLDAEPYRFEITLLHETGHMVMSMLAGGRRLEGQPVASIPHSTAALSDRTTAFSEGYAIHLETVEAHLGRAPWIRQPYHRELIQFGDGPYRAQEYFRHASDLTSYSQNLARYADVRDNNFSFESAFQGPDYLRVQLEKARDFATVRDANQLLQSEGFYASFFFLYVMRGALPAEAVVQERERQLMRSMRALLGSGADGSRPWLPQLAIEHMKLFPEQKTELVDALNDLSHGVFVDAGAAALWRAHYLAALRLDLQRLNVKEIGAARARWREQVMANPEVLFSRVGPEIPCRVAPVKVRLVAFGEDAPLGFDINTVQPGVMRLIPGVTEAEIAAWLEQRAAKPFAGAADFRARGGLREGTLAAMEF
jgi:hypothetical protein